MRAACAAGAPRAVPVTAARAHIEAGMLTLAYSQCRERVETAKLLQRQRARQTASQPESVCRLCCIVNMAHLHQRDTDNEALPSQGMDTASLAVQKDALSSVGRFFAMTLHAAGSSIHVSPRAAVCAEHRNAETDAKSACTTYLLSISKRPTPYVG